MSGRPCVTVHVCLITEASAKKTLPVQCLKSVVCSGCCSSRKQSDSAPMSYVIDRPYWRWRSLLPCQLNNAKAVASQQPILEGVCRTDKDALQSGVLAR